MLPSDLCLFSRHRGFPLCDFFTQAVTHSHSTESLDGPLPGPVQSSLCPPAKRELHRDAKLSFAYCCPSDLGDPIAWMNCRLLLNSLFISSLVIYRILEMEVLSQKSMWPSIPWIWGERKKCRMHWPYRWILKGKSNTTQSLDRGSPKTR